MENWWLEWLSGLGLDLIKPRGRVGGGLDWRGDVGSVWGGENGLGEKVEAGSH